jgi:hypothetical protein
LIIVCQDIILINAIERSTKGIYQIVIFNKMSSALDYIYNSIPHLIVINIINDDPIAVKKINDIEADSPVMGISIGITETRSHSFSHYGEVTQLAAEMKKFA